MKKNVLSLSITAAVLGMGLVGGVQAMQGAPSGATGGTGLALNGNGVGQMLLVPYYTAQADNSTLLNLVNTDKINGKAVKVRFRGAANSDDVFDFQVFLSPGDVWTAKISKGATGYATLTTTDASCTKPSKTTLNSTAFLPGRLDPSLTGDALAAGTREGYIEIFNMADIPKYADTIAAAAVAATVTAHPAHGAGTNVAGPDLVVGSTGVAGQDNINDLYWAIKHAANVAPCAGTAWDALDLANLASTPAAKAAGLIAPTTGLMANWTIINVVGAAAWSGTATAVATTGGLFGNVVYWPQVGTSAGNVDAFTADPLLRSDAFGYNKTTTILGAAGAAAVAATWVDLPDMSTPYGTDVGTAAKTAMAGAGGLSGAPVVAAVNAVAVGSSLATYLAAAALAAGYVAGDATILTTAYNGVANPAPKTQAFDLTTAISRSSVSNEFLTDTSITASTDWVFSMPTRRYSTSLAYAKIGGVGLDAVAGNDDGRRFTDIVADGGGAIANGYFTRTNTAVIGRKICVVYASTASAYSVWNREETNLTSPTNTIVSPATPAAPFAICGEAAVLSINNGGVTNPTGSLKATVAQSDLDFGTTRDGWMTVNTPSATVNGGLPVLGGAFFRAFAGSASFGTYFNHR